MYNDNEDSKYFKLKIDNSANKIKTYKIKTLDLPDSNVDIPQLTFDAVVIINGNEFHKLCREMGSLGTFVEFKCLADKFIMTCKGDTAELEVIFRTRKNKKDKKDKKDIDDDDEDSSKGVEIIKQPEPQIVQGIFDLSSINTFSKFASICTAIEIYMKNDTPLFIKYEIATLGKAVVCISPVKEDIQRIQVIVMKSHIIKRLKM